MKRRENLTIPEQILALPQMRHWKESKENRCIFPKKYLSCSLVLAATRGDIPVRPCDVPGRCKPDDVNFEYTLDFWPEITRSDQDWFSHRSTVDSLLHYDGSSFASDILLEFRSNFLQELEWSKAREIWIGHLKNKASDCLFARLPIEIVKMILEKCGEERLKFLPEKENDLQLLHPSKQIYVGWRENTVDWLDVASYKGPVWISFDKEHFVSSWLEVFWSQYSVLERVAEAEKEAKDDTDGERFLKLDKEDRDDKDEDEDEDKDEDDDVTYKQDLLFWECFDD